MTDFQFNDEAQFNSINMRQTNENKGMIGFLVKRGIVKSKESAEKMLLGVAGVFFLLTILVIILM